MELSWLFQNEIAYTWFMRVLPPVEEQIRDERAKDPLASVSKLEAALEKHFSRGFSYQYVSKIADKVAREGLIEADRTKLEERLQFTRENYRMMRERLLKILYWKPEDGAKQPANRDVNEAAKNIVMMDLAILQAEAAAGMYKKPVEGLRCWRGRYTTSRCRAKYGPSLLRRRSAGGCSLR
jgi:hypothetical protein